MRQRRSHISGREPLLGGRHAVRLTGMEPALGGEFRPLYGRFRVKGLEAPPVVGRRRPLVVLAEADEDTAELVILLAESNGYDIKRSGDGLEAYRLTQAFEPNLLVVSFRLPGVDGLGLVRRVRTDPNELVRHVPILVMTARHHPHDMMMAFDCGADDYLKKPFNNVQTMLRCWRRIISGCRRPSPLTALLSEDAAIQQAALSYLLDSQPPGLVVGLGDLLWQPDHTVRAAVRWALQRLGTDEAAALLEQDRPWIPRND